MEVRFYLTGQDAWNFQKSVLLRPRVLLPLVALFVLIIGLILLTSLIGPISSTSSAFNILFLFLLLLFIVLIVVYLRARMTNDMARRLAAQGEHTITISPEGFRHKQNLGDAMISWRAIKEIKADTNNLYFMVDSNVLMAHVIPRRAFASPQDADAFLGWAKTFWASGNNVQQAGTPGSASGYERWG